MLTLFIIAGVVAMVIGPILMLRPSSRDNRLAKLRQKAAQSGLKLTMFNQHERSVAIYIKTWPEQLDITPWSLLKGSLDHALHFDGTWDWEDQQAPKHWHGVIRDLLSAIDDEVIGISADSQGLGLHWKETSSQKLPQIKQWLEVYGAKLYSVGAELVQPNSLHP